MGAGIPADADLSPATGVPRLRAPANRVSPRARWYWAIRALAGWVVVFAIEGVTLLGSHPASAVLGMVLGATGAIAILHVGVMPQWRYRVHRWEDGTNAVYTQTGWFTQERRIAPVNRIQTVDTARGPIEQLFGLANVTVTTASAAGPLRIHGLALTTAERLVEQLTTHAHDADDAT
ncbi:MAG TPA: PH domain-containing protein [Jatrophihabitantaceae bacterium]|nr:PH domain-containing protein [Jatrophihabitantaceae bacterium]